MAQLFLSPTAFILLLFFSFSSLNVSCSVRAARLASRLRPRAASAWNGRADAPAADRYAKTNFSPYYIPIGSFSIDDANPLISFTPDGAWAEARHPALVDHTMHTASVSGATANLVFTGIGVEWFGSMSAKHGIAEVYINNTLIAKVDAYKPTWLKRQLLFDVDHLPFGTHHIAIVNSGKKRRKSGGTFIDIDAFVVNPAQSSGLPQEEAATKSALRLLDLPLISPLRQMEGNTQNPTAQRVAQTTGSKAASWNLSQAGATGVHAMQLAVVSSTHAIVIDKVEHNPLTIDGHPAWGALYDLRTNQVRPLDLKSNSFCAGGTFLSNGSLVNVGGNPVIHDKTGAADFGDLNGLQAVRLFHPELCDNQGVGCDIIEAPHTLRLASPRWYNTVLRLDDGAAMIIGGSTRGGWMNNATTNNPTFEFFPPKNIHGFNGVPIPSSFLADTLNSNLFPIAFLLPDGRIFMAANREAMIYDWKSNAEQRLPQIPNGVRVTYPMTGTAALLPLSSQNNYTPSVVICGGSAIDDTRPGYDIDSQEPASSQCVRMDLTEAGVQMGWEVEHMPEARVMPDAVLLPTGDAVILNGAGTGIAGYGNVKNQVGYSNADHPTLTPVLYRPSEPSGSRFTAQDMPTSDIARLYHSVATLVPDGRIMIAGSNPNLDRSTAQYATEYRVEWLEPEWMKDETPRPVATLSTTSLPYASTFTVSLDLHGGDSADIKVALMDLGFVTHSLHMNSRLVYLDFKLTGGNETYITLDVNSPPIAPVYPPGPGWIYIVVGEKWSVASRVLVGDGSNPPEDLEALQNMLSNSNHISLSEVAAGGEGAESI